MLLVNCRLLFSELLPPYPSSQIFGKNSKTKDLTPLASRLSSQRERERTVSLDSYSFWELA